MLTENVSAVSPFHEKCKGKIFRYKNKNHTWLQIYVKLSVLLFPDIKYSDKMLNYEDGIKMLKYLEDAVNKGIIIARDKPGYLNGKSKDVPFTYI